MYVSVQQLLNDVSTLKQEELDCYPMMK